MTPVCREGYKFCQEGCIPCYHTDLNSRLKPAAFMDMAQEIAYWAARELGFGYEDLHVHHTAWVLCRLHIHFAEAPRWQEPVKLYTWHKGVSGLFYLRDFDLRAADGRPLVQATSSWVVIDERTRHFVRPEDLQVLKLDQLVEDAIAEPAPKVVVPPGRTAEAAGSHTVSYSDLDVNGHTNNARYGVWAMDCLPLEEAQKPVKDLYINFNKETLPGETVQLYRLKAGDAWLVEGRVDGKPCFTVKMTF